MNIENNQTINKYISLPGNLQREVSDFIDFLTTKYQEETQTEKKKKRTSNFGSAKGLIIMGDDFDDPIEDFNEYM